MNNVPDAANFVKYHKALELYLGISQDKLTPVNYARVVKARQKLGRLTEIQFYDLSTDVYDELQRRINETSEKPKHLPPQSTYHPKRNQARQKLAALPSQRFKDLVNDVLYEIDRRRLASEPVEVFPESGKEAEEEEEEEESEGLPQLKVTGEDDEEVTETGETPSQREIKPSKVVPKRAELTWSSDDEDDDESAASYPAMEVHSLDPKGAKEVKVKAVEPKTVDVSELSKKEEELATLSSELNEVKSELDNVKSELAAKDEAVRHSQEELQEKEDLLRQKDELLAQRQEDLAQKEDEVSAKETQVGELQKHLSSLQDRLDHAENRTRQQSADIDTLRDTSARNTELSFSLEKEKEAAGKLAQENVSFQKLIGELRAQLATVQSTRSAENSQLSSVHEDYAALERQYATATREREAVDRKVQDLEAEVDTKRSQNAAMQKQHDESMQSLRAANEQLLQRNMQLQQVQVEHETASRGQAVQQQELQQKHQALQRDYETLKNTMSVPVEKLSGGKAGAPSQWQLTYQKQRSAEVVRSLLAKSTAEMHQLTRYCDVDGSVPLESVADLYASVEGLLAYATQKDVVADGLFHGASEIVSAASAIVREAGSTDPTSTVGERTQLIKSSLSNLLTMVRYFSLYRDVIPPLLVHASIGDVYFAVCDLVSVAKIHAVGDGLVSAIEASRRRRDSQLAALRALDADSSPTPARTLAARPSLSLKTGREELNAATEVSRARAVQSPAMAVARYSAEPPRTPTYEEAISQVRPLRMAQKLSSQETLESPERLEDEHRRSHFALSPVATDSRLTESTGGIVSGLKNVLSSVSSGLGVGTASTPLPKTRATKAVEAVSKSEGASLDSRKVSVSSLASKFTSTNEVVPAKTPITPRSQSSMLSKLKQRFEEPAEASTASNQGLDSATPSPIRLNSSLGGVAKAFDTFGAKRRSGEAGSEARDLSRDEKSREAEVAESRAGESERQSQGPSYESDSQSYESQTQSHESEKASQRQSYQSQSLSHEPSYSQSMSHEPSYSHSLSQEPPYESQRQSQRQSYESQSMSQESSYESHSIHSDTEPVDQSHSQPYPADQSQRESSQSSLQPAYQPQNSQASYGSVAQAFGAAAASAFETVKGIGSRKPSVGLGLKTVDPADYDSSGMDTFTESKALDRTPKLSASGVDPDATPKYGSVATAGLDVSPKSYTSFSSRASLSDPPNDPYGGYSVSDFAKPTAMQSYDTLGLSSLDSYETAQSEADGSGPLLMSASGSALSSSLNSGVNSALGSAGSRKSLGQQYLESGSSTITNGQPVSLGLPERHTVYASTSADVKRNSAQSGASAKSASASSQPGYRNSATYASDSVMKPKAQYRDSASYASESVMGQPGKPAESEEAEKSKEVTVDGDSSSLVSKSMPKPVSHRPNAPPPNPFETAQEVTPQSGDESGDEIAVSRHTSRHSEVSEVSEVSESEPTTPVKRIVRTVKAVKTTRRTSASPAKRESGISSRSGSSSRSSRSGSPAKRHSRPSGVSSRSGSPVKRNSGVREVSGATEVSSRHTSRHTSTTVSRHTSRHTSTTASRHTSTTASRHLSNASVSQTSQVTDSSASPQDSEQSFESADSQPVSSDSEEDFDFENFNTLDPDNTLKELLLYLEHQTVEVIAAIQLLLKSIRDPHATRGLLRGAADQIITVVKQMCEGTRTLMGQSRYADAMSHAQYVVDVLEDCVKRMDKLYGKNTSQDGSFADKEFKQRSAGIAFDIARSTKELVKTVEEASLRDEIAVIDSRLNAQK